MTIQTRDNEHLGYSHVGELEEGEGMDCKTIQKAKSSGFAEEMRGKPKQKKERVQHGTQISGLNKNGLQPMRTDLPTSSILQCAAGV